MQIESGEVGLLLLNIENSTTIEDLANVVMFQVFQIKKTCEQSFMIDEAVKRKIDFIKQHDRRNKKYL